MFVCSTQSASHHHRAANARRQAEPPRFPRRRKVLRPVRRLVLGFRKPEPLFRVTRSNFKPFYYIDCYCSSAGRKIKFDCKIISHAVVDTKIIVSILRNGRYGIYLYDVLMGIWIHVVSGDFLPFRGRVVFASDKWFGIPIFYLKNDNTVFAYEFDLSAEQRFVGRRVEDFKPFKPTLLPNYYEYNVFDEAAYSDADSDHLDFLIDLYYDEKCPGNGCLCLLMFRDDDDAEREPHVLVSTFQVIEEKKRGTITSARAASYHRCVHQRCILCDLSGEEATIHHRSHPSSGCIVTFFTA